LTFGFGFKKCHFRPPPFKLERGFWPLGVSRWLLIMMKAKNT
jgi:hypothetical protein